MSLADKNSTVTIDPSSQAGVSDWHVNGTDHLAQQWFWVGSGSGPEVSLDALTLNSASTSDDDFDPGDEVARLAYSGTGFDINVTLELTGSNGTSSKIGEIIEIINTSSTQSLSLRFFQYNDLELGGTQDDALGYIITPPGNTAIQADLGGVFVSETAATPVPDHREVALGAATLTSLNDGVATTLSDNTGPLGPGDLTWAFQWDVNLPADGTLIISKNKNLTIPTPAAGLAGTALLALAAARRRRAL
ncbi:MAG: hypothetical protein CMJ49_04825 [Planctomycetaceae bacterium]|nr:hypothetical protein [Planctomycetaceae bacterium]